MNQFKNSPAAPLQRMAAPAAALMGLTVLLSAALRLAPTGSLVPAARLAHRIAATGVLLLVVAMVLKARRAGDASAWRASGALLALVIALSLLGVVTPHVQSPLVVLGNLLGGFAVFVLCLRLAWPLSAPPAPVAALRAALVLVVLQVALGALLSGAPAVHGDPLAAALRPLHILGATAAAVVAVLLAAHCWHLGRPGWALALGLPPLAQFVLGPLLLRLGQPVAPTLLHNTLALVLLSALVLLMPRDRASATS